MLCETFKIIPILIQVGWLIMENVGVSLQNLYCIKKGFDIVFSLNGILQFWAEQIIVLFLCVFILFFHVVAESEQKLSLQN